MDTPDEAYWVEIGGDDRIHPFGMHKTVNQDTVDVVSSITDDDNQPRRWVFVRDGRHQVWVQVRATDEVGYELQPDERVSEAELDAITLKHDAIRDGSRVSIEEARALVESGKPEQVPHALVALYYAARADPDITEGDVDSLRELMHEHTNQIDTDHEPTLRRILIDRESDEERNG